MAWKVKLNAYSALEYTECCGHKGIISSLSFCTDYSGLYAASSLSGNIALYDEASSEAAVGYLGGTSKPVMQVRY